MDTNTEVLFSCISTTGENLLPSLDEISVRAFKAGIRITEFLRDEDGDSHTWVDAHVVLTPAMEATLNETGTLDVDLTNGLILSVDLP